MAALPPLAQRLLLRGDGGPAWSVVHATAMTDWPAVAAARRGCWGVMVLIASATAVAFDVVRDVMRAFDAADWLVVWCVDRLRGLRLRGGSSSMVVVVLDAVQLLADHLWWLDAVAVPTLAQATALLVGPGLRYVRLVVAVTAPAATEMAALVAAVLVWTWSSPLSPATLEVRVGGGSGRQQRRFRLARDGWSVTLTVPTTVAAVVESALAPRVGRGRKTTECRGEGSCR